MAVGENAGSVFPNVIDGYTWNKSILGSLGESQLLQLI